MTSGSSQQGSKSTLTFSLLLFSGLWSVGFTSGVQVLMAEGDMDLVISFWWFLKGTEHAFMSKK